MKTLVLIFFFKYLYTELNLRNKFESTLYLTLDENDSFKILSIEK